MTRPADDAAEVLREVTAAAAREHGLSPDLLDGYAAALLAVARSGQGMTGAQRDACRALGAGAAEQGIALPVVVDLYMTASRMLWPRLPGLVAGAGRRSLTTTEVVRIGELVWRAADTALAALASGHLDSQRDVVRREEAFRREFVDDLLSGRAEIGSLVDRAERFGLSLAAPHLVAVTAASGPVDSGMPNSALIEQDLRRGLGVGGVLVAAAAGQLVCVLAADPRRTPTEADAVARTLAQITGTAVARATRSRRWRTGVGRAHPGPLGVVRSYREATDALDVARRLDLPDPVALARDLLVYRVLMRDESAIADLVDTVLGPLVGVRGGAEPLLAALEAYFAAGGNATEAARRLHLSVRALTYRLQRVHQLTGYRAADPAAHLTLSVAVTGARLLDWPSPDLRPV
ncbi:PucR family transcriptional regulator [Trujillonella humicola]|uniref:PucR family transcriptional regulator n=1 Tax=Trujillonella humicola TaxID=3383699 RepID=UPI003906A0CA